LFPFSLLSSSTLSKMSVNNVQKYDIEKFPIELTKFEPITLDPNEKLSAEKKAHLLANIQIMRDAIIFFTATGSARGVAGHTGGPL